MVSQGGVHQKSDRVCFVDRKNINVRNFAFNNRILRFAGCTLGKTEDSIF